MSITLARSIRLKNIIALEKLKQERLEQGRLIIREDKIKKQNESLNKVRIVRK
jgi:hypothetical protein|tara:strand:+ start:391 stop:549 length:159 start_codon:yes stop_codon:yes gene_type:complete